MNVKISNGWIEVRSAGESVRRYSTSPLTWLLMALVFVVSFQVVKTAELIPYLQRAVSETNPSIALTGGKHCIQSLASNVETALTSTPVSQDCLLPSIRLTTPVNTLVDMQRSLEHGDPNLGHEDGGDQPYYKATVQFDGQPLQRCKICLRGTMPWHHHIEKPSLRIKLKTEDMRGGDRYIELTRPEDALAVKNWLPMQLASEVGLLSDQSDHVRVFVNNKYLGLYVRAMRQGEPLALTNHRMPGTFFKGDSEGDLWSSLDDWKMNGEMADEDQAVFRQFLALLEPPTTQAKLDRLRIVFDFEVYARWAALMAVTGSLHTDAVHNHAYFFCANQGKIESIPWDCNSFGMHAEPQTPVDTSPHRVIRALLCDPNWVHRRNQWIYKLVTGAASAEQLIKRVDDHLQRVGAELVSDRNTAENRLTYVGWHFIPASPSQLKRHRDELADWIRARQVFLLQYLNHASVYVQRKANSDQGSVICVDGNAAIRIDTVAENGLAIRSQVVLPSLSEEAQTFTSIPYEEPLEVPYLTSVPRQLLVDGNASTLRFFNAITMRPIEPKISAVPIELTDQRSRTLHNDLRPDEDGIANPRVIRLGPGSVDLREDLVITSHQRLIIEPGTQIGLAASVGIYCEGMMTALGSELQPITFQRLNDDKPWGAIAVCGPESGGSELAWCAVAGGSTGKFQARRFKGMFNAYNCPQITIRQCDFGANVVGDDAVNVAESKFAIHHCTWQNALSDALDLDMSEGSISDCDWQNSGNDGLDMMTCNVDIQDCMFSGSGDKGISVGEGSRLIARRVTIRNCARGTELKDNSFAEFIECRFQQNEVAAHAYQKKTFYGRGGTGRFVNCTFLGNQLDLFPEKRCRFEVSGTEINSIDGQEKHVIFIQPVNE